MLIGSNTPLNYKDILCIVGLVACIIIESIADEQQWIYQNAKHSTPRRSTRSTRSNVKKQVPQTSYCRPEDLTRGFITGGLFRYSRHPNFACEQTIWYIVYAFGCIATVASFVLLTGSAHGGIGRWLLLWLS
jgi:steroid 5-alpha reductase family enzyme